MKLPRLFRGLAALLAAFVALVFAPTAAFAQATGVTADIFAGIGGGNGNYAGATLGGQTPVYPLALSGLVRLTPGTGAGSADRLIVKALNIPASGTTTVNLTSSLDPFGVAAACIKVKAIYVAASSGNTNDILVKPGATNSFSGPLSGTTPSIAVRPGGVYLDALPNTGWTVTASTGDQMDISNSSSGTAVTGTLAIVCTSA